MTNPLAELSDRGVSIWLDDLSRQRLTTGSLAGLVAHDHVVGVTTNPTIFAKSIAGSDAYAQQIREMWARGAAAKFALWFCAAAVATLILFRLGGSLAMLAARAGAFLGDPAGRLGLANLRRPGATTPLMLVSVGLGLSTLAAVALIFPSAATDPTP